MKEAIYAENSQQQGSMPYSQAIRVGNVIYVAGQGPIDPVTDELAGDTLDLQARRALDNVAAILEAAGAKLSDVVKVNVILGDGVNFGHFNEIYKEYFSEPYPARTIWPSSMGFMVQIDAIAHLS